METHMLAFSIGVLMLAVGQPKDATPGNPPAILIASQIDADGNLVLVRYKTIFLQPAGPNSAGGPIYNERSLKNVSLKGVKIYGGDGKEVTIEDARKMLGDKDSPVLASSGGVPRLPFYRAAFKDDVLLFSFPRESPTWMTIQEPGVQVRMGGTPKVPSPPR
jgi:hypothetical protein